MKHVRVRAREWMDRPGATNTLFWASCVKLPLTNKQSLAAAGSLVCNLLTVDLASHLSECLFSYYTRLGMHKDGNSLNDLSEIMLQRYWQYTRKSAFKGA